MLALSISLERFIVLNLVNHVFTILCELPEVAFGYLKLHKLIVLFLCECGCHFGLVKDVLV